MVERKKREKEKIRKGKNVLRIVKRIKKENDIVFSVVLQNIPEDILRYFTKIS
jgi:hypothetical protein